MTKVIQHEGFMYSLNSEGEIVAVASVGQIVKLGQKVWIGQRTLRQLFSSPGEVVKIFLSGQKGITSDIIQVRYQNNNIINLKLDDVMTEIRS